MSLISVGASLPLGYQLHDGATGKFVRAHVRDQANAAVTGSPFALTHVAQGFYSNTAYTVLIANTKLKATYIVFDDAGFTIESVFHTRGAAETDVETQVEVARTDVLTRLGTPAGASVSADIAAVKADSGTLITRLTAGRATNLDNLDATVGSRSTQTSVNSIQADTDDIQLKIGTPVVTLAADIAGVQTTVNTINTRVGSPVGASISADIAAVQTTANAVNTKLGTPAGASVSADIAAIKADSGTLVTRLTAGRASNLDFLDVLLSTRSTQTSVDALQTTANTINTRIGAPVGASISADIAAVQTTANTIDTRIGAPVGASISADIAAVQTTASAINTKLGTPVGASVSIDIAAVQTTATAINTKLGTPAGASVSADIAAVKSDTATLTSRLTSGRASNLDFLDVLLSTRATQTSVNSVQADTDDIQVKIGTPVGASLSVDIAAVQTTANAINTKLGTPAGASVSADIAAVKSDSGTLITRLTSGRASNLDFLDVLLSTRATQTSVDAVQADTDDIQVKIGTPVGASLSVDIAAVQTTASAVNTKLGTPAGASVSADIAAVFSRIGAPVGASISADIAAVKTQLNSIETKVDDLSSASDSAISIPSTFLVPTTGTNIFRIYWRHFAAGIPDNPFSGPDINIERSNGTDIVASTAMTLEVTGVYYYDYSVPDTADNGIQVIVKVDYVNDSGGPTFQAIATANQTSSASAIDDILTILGTPAGVSVSADIAALQTTSNTINTKIGTPAGASLSADVAAIFSRIGAPAGASVSADIAAVKADTATLTSRLTSGRATNLDNLNATVSSRSTQTSVDAIQADTDDIQAKIGTPVATLATDIAGVQTTANAINTKLGTPAGASVSADIAAVKADTATLTSRLTSGRATNLDNLDATVSSRATQTSVNGIQSDIDTLEPTITGIASDTATLILRLTAGRATNLDFLNVSVSSRATQTSVDAVQTTANAINTKLGTPAGASVSADIAAVKADTAAILDDTGTSGVLVASAEKDSIVDRVWDELQSGHTTAGTFGKRLDADMTTRESESSALSRFNTTSSAIAALQLDTDDIQMKIGTPVSSVSADIAANRVDILAVRAQTDLISFDGGNRVNVHVILNDDKSNYALSTGSRALVADDVWDEILSGHLIPFSAGAALNNISGFTLATVAAAVWDEQALPHSIAGSFGILTQVIHQSSLVTTGQLTNGSFGLAALSATITNSTAATTAAVVAQNPNIAAIIPAVNASKIAVIAEIDQNQILLEALAIQLTAAEADIIADIAVVSGKVDAVSAQVGAIQNNTTVRFIVPERISKPLAGNKNYQIHLRLYDDVGFPEAPDSAPTIRIRRLDTNVDVVLNVAMTQDGVKVGAYFYNLVISAGSDIYPALVEATVVENGATRYVPAVTEITEFDSDLDAIQAQLTAVQNTVSATQLSVDSGVYGLAALKTGQTDIVVEINQNETLINLVKAKTDIIPVDPATLASVSAVNATVLTRPDITAIQTRLDLLRDAIRGTANRTNTQVYDKIDFTGVMQTSDPRLNFLDAAVSSRSTLDAATVWAYATRTLTASTLSAASIQAIWDFLTSAATVPGSFGLRIGTNLDATVSSRATAGQVTSLLVGVAQEASLGALSTLVSTEANENEAKLNALQADVTLIKAKTTNLPADPSSASAMSAGFNANTIAVANVALNVTGIKTKTDNLPVDPAKESSVLARPTNPVLTSDIRLNRLDVNVSTRSTLTTGDLALLATTAQLSAGNAALTTEINANQVDIAAVQTTANLIKAKTDQLVYTSGRVDAVISGAQEDAIVDKVWNELNASHVAVGSMGESLSDAAGGASPSVIAAAVWDEATAGHVTASTFGKLAADIKVDTGAINTKIGTPAGASVSADIAAITESHRTCRMSTTMNSAGTDQEVIVWAEEAGERITVSSACTITIKTAIGATVWTATLASPNADGVFRFTNAFVAVADVSYYILMSITVAGQPVVTQQAFITVG